MTSAICRPKVSVSPAGVGLLAGVGIAGTAIGIGSEMPPTTSTSIGWADASDAPPVANRINAAWRIRRCKFAVMLNPIFMPNLSG